MWAACGLWALRWAVVVARLFHPGNKRVEEHGSELQELEEHEGKVEVVDGVARVHRAVHAAAPGWG